MEEQTFNPYQSPASTPMSFSASEAIDPEMPCYKLLSVGSVALATFLGSLLAGGAVMAITYRRLGRAAAAIHSLVCPTSPTVAILAAAMLSSFSGSSCSWLGWRGNSRR